jgi:DnaJ-class molecular chaperone
MKKLSVRPLKQVIRSLDVVEKCPACQGSGVLPGKLPDDAVVPCPTCHGQGYKENKKKTVRTEEVPCTNPACHGGKIKVSRIVSGQVIEEEGICPVCEGYGVIHREIVTYTPERTVCKDCGGSGKLTAGEMRLKGMEDLCPACHGTGLKVQKPAARKLAFKSLLTFYQPAAAVVGGYFRLMLHSVRAMLKRS